jgi:vacuolar-type H+-ATPase subunit D/Vma8
MANKVHTNPNQVNSKSSHYTLCKFQKHLWATFREIFGQNLNLYIRQMMFYKMHQKMNSELNNTSAVVNLTDQVIIPPNQVIIHVPCVFQSPSMKNYFE